jgi:hypothetical protein
MPHPKETHRRVRRTEMEAMIDPHAAAQRNGMPGSLNMVADAFKLLPSKRGEPQESWSTARWARKRKGWGVPYLKAHDA